ncbi:NAD(P)/FAD-dependent oxidoreductase [Romboutsia ilealis]|uniref:NAD(P)/FAD-dependent oxidoreductase n=1 Tax=Romboutsia faecis TaxID=2764597 RepID=A0ABR7JPT6_9FIRM|nr:NAD(P)/FAD-dependent oxidoreductase [Romboutsia faecis]MBC5996931.1 NAD(P)/FAD-dependent oxidoreductase [Romboutsia faecis]MRN24567.1 NAD(P)/FAD-dependent oxidoreductase [Romboutsia ilealis]
MRYDIAIVGSGPAGLSAAINAKIRNKNIILFGNENLSNKLTKAPSIDNYLGFYDISGVELKDKFLEHVKNLDIDICEKRINNIYSMGDYFALMSGDSMYEATTVILATGVEYGKPIKGEEEFLGKGVGYCATCDAPLYRDKKVAIIGYNKESEEEANFLSEIASKTYFIPMYKNESLMRGNHELDTSIEVINDRPIQIQGETLVNKVSFKEKDIDVDGVFVIKDSASLKSLVPGLETDGPHVIVDINMKTNIDGCFACGDCAGKPYSYIKSAGQGQIAALNAVSYLDKLKMEARKKEKLEQR